MKEEVLADKGLVTDCKVFYIKKSSNVITDIKYYVRSYFVQYILGCFRAKVNKIEIYHKKGQ